MSFFEVLMLALIVIFLVCAGLMILMFLFVGGVGVVYQARESVQKEPGFVSLTLFILSGVVSISGLASNIPVFWKVVSVLGGLLLASLAIRVFASSARRRRGGG